MALKTPAVLRTPWFSHDRAELEILLSLQFHLPRQWNSIPLITESTSDGVPAIEVKSEGLTHTGKDWYYNVVVTLCNMQSARCSEFYSIGEYSEEGSFLRSVLTWEFNGASFSPSRISSVRTGGTGDRIVNMEISGRFSALEMPDKDICVYGSGVPYYSEAALRKTVLAIAENRNSRFFLNFPNRRFLPVVISEDLTGDILDRNPMVGFVNHIAEVFAASARKGGLRSDIVVCSLNNLGSDSKICATASTPETIRKKIKAVAETLRDRLRIDSSWDSRVLLIVDSATSLAGLGDRSETEKDVYRILSEMIVPTKKNTDVTIMLIDRSDRIGHLQTMFMKGDEPRIFLGNVPLYLNHENTFMPWKHFSAVVATSSSSSKLEGFYYDPQENLFAQITLACYAKSEIELTRDLQGMPLPLGERFPSKVLMGAGAKPEELGRRKRIHWNMGTQHILHVLGETRQDTKKWLRSFLTYFSRGENPIDVIYCNHVNDMDNVKTVDSLTKIAEILQEAVKKNEQPFGLKTPKPFKVLVLDNIYEILQELQPSSLETYHTAKIAASIGESLSKLITQNSRLKYFRLVLISSDPKTFEESAAFNLSVLPRLFLGNPHRCPAAFIPCDTIGDTAEESESIWWSPGTGNPEPMIVRPQSSYQNI